MEARFRRLDQAVLTPLTRMPRLYILWVALLVAIVAWGIYAYSTQFSSGLVVTGMRDKIFWGLYISNFVFFIGISHAGTLISAILRLTHAPWRMPITRMAEFITVVALMFGALFPIIDLGRPDRILNLFIFGRWQSPILWDMLAITTYLTGSLIYLYLPLIPDLALCRDSIAQRVSPLKRWFYTTLSLGWVGTPRQHRKLGTALGMMMIIIIPVAVSVHTVVSWIFAMTMRAGWNSTVFGIYFVAGAIFSGIATIIIVMAVLRKLYHLEEFITEKHFRYLGYLMGAFVIIMVYFNLSEHLTTGYKVAEGEGFLLTQLMTGPYSSLFWLYIVGGLLIPAFLVFLPWTRTILGIVVASVLVDVTMWIERFLIVVPTLRVPLVPGEPASYAPTWVEWSITAAAFAGFMLVITLFSRLFPIISVWEVKEQEEKELAIQPAPGPRVSVPVPESMDD
ncbi:MAG: NrfD/PsrC family molybdoenzyme membrane anchor subunit [Dehalococcoidia bacterium]